MHPNYRTEGLSKNQNKLSPDQISPWKDFENTARSFARGVTGNPTPGFNEISQEERFLVGNELGVQSRFVEHVGQTMAKIYDSLGYHVRFGDFQSGIPMKTSKGSGGNYPDLAIIAMDSRHMRIYGEVKTDWTFHPKNKKQSEEQFLAARLGIYYSHDMTFAKMLTHHPSHRAARALHGRLP